MDGRAGGIIYLPRESHGCLVRVAQTIHVFVGLPDKQTKVQVE
jgi:hypothetical protein